MQKPQNFGFQILRVIWDECVFSSELKDFDGGFFNSLYLQIISKKYALIWDHYLNYNSCDKQLIFQRFSFIQYSFDHQIVAQMHCKWFESQRLSIKIMNIKYSNQTHSFATTKT